MQLQFSDLDCVCLAVNKNAARTGVTVRKYRLVSGISREFSTPHNATIILFRKFWTSAVKQFKYNCENADFF